MKLILSLTAILFLASCARSQGGFSAFELGRPPGLGIECTATECSCDLGAPETSKRTCKGILSACKDIVDADTITCQVKKEPRTCICKKL